MNKEELIEKVFLTLVTTDWQMGSDEDNKGRANQIIALCEPYYREKHRDIAKKAVNSCDFIFTENYTGMVTCASVDEAIQAINKRMGGE